MSRYRTISVKMWGDDRFSRLSKPKPNAQTLWIYLLTGPHTTALPGVFVAGEAALAEALEWPKEAFRKAFAEVINEGLIEVDIKTRLAFIPKAIRHNPPQSLNVVKGWRKVFDELPDCVLKGRIYMAVLDSIAVLGLSLAYTQAFGDAFVYDKAYPEQEQEQNKTRTEHRGNGKRQPLDTPTSLTITDEMRDFATKHGVFDIAEQTEAMLDHFHAKGESRADWVATWRTWIRNSKKFGGGRYGTGKSKTDINRENAERLRARLDSQDSGGEFGGSF